MRRSFLLVGFVAGLGCAVAACAGGGEQDLNPQPLPPNTTSSGGSEPVPPVDNPTPGGDTTTGSATSGSSSTGSSGAATSSGSSGSSGGAVTADAGVDASPGDQ